MEAQQTPLKVKNNKKLQISIDLRVITGLLSLSLITLIVLWNPWNGLAAGSGNKSDRVVSTTGEAVIKAEPDEFMFYATFVQKDSNKEAARAASDQKGREVAPKLKELGVPENKIKSNSYGYDSSYGRTSSEYSYSLSYEIIVDNKDLAQKVQDYLAVSGAEGSISPYPSFSREKRKELEAQAREKAIEDARKKADQTAQNTGVKIVKIQSVKDNPNGNYGGLEELSIEGADPQSGLMNDKSLPIMAGENEFYFSVEATFTVK